MALCAVCCVLCAVLVLRELTQAGGQSADQATEGARAIMDTFDRVSRALWSLELSSMP